MSVPAVGINGRFFNLSPGGQATKRLEEAEDFFLAGNLNEALAAAQQAWREHPRESDVFRVLAYVHTARGEYPPAAQSAYQAVVTDGDNPASLATLAQVYLTFGMLPLAEETLVPAVQRFPDDSSLLALLADVRFRRHQEDAGRDLARRALQRNPTDAYAKALLGGHYLRRKDYDNAVQLLDRAAEVYDSRWDYQRDYGIAALHTAREETALHALIRSFRMNPADTRLQQYLHFALKIADRANPFSGFWRLSLFIYDRGWASTLLTIAIIILVLVGGIWLMVARVGEFETFTPALLLLCAAGLLVMSWQGLRMRWKHGERYAEWLDERLEELEGR
jgi:tetratricopeptide (TPR) repeat protein